MANDSFKTIILSDGRTAMMRRPLGEDLIRANQVAPKGGDPFSFTYALLAQVTVIDGQPQFLDTIKKLYASDLDKLASEANSTDFLDSSSKTSPPLSKEDSASQK